MARHLDRRHDGDEPRLRVRHQLCDVVLRIEAAVRLAVEAPLGGVTVRVPDDRLAPPRAYLGEPWILADLDTPPLVVGQVQVQPVELMERGEIDRKSTRLNSSHLVISYAVFCLKKKKNLMSWL